MGHDNSLGQNLRDPESIIQDCIVCPRKPTWDPKVSKITGLPFILILILGIYILYKLEF